MSNDCRARLTCYSCGAARHCSNERLEKDLIQPKFLEGPNGKKPEVTKDKGRLFQMIVEKA